MNDLIDEPFFLSNLAMIRERIASACASCGRSSSEIRLLPITKTFPLGASLGVRKPFGSLLDYLWFFSG